MKLGQIVVGAVYEGGKSGPRRVVKIGRPIAGEPFVQWIRVSTGKTGWTGMRLWCKWAKQRIDTPHTL